MAQIQLWDRPWAHLDRAGLRWRMLTNAAGPMRHDGFGAVWAYADAEAGPKIAGRKNAGKQETEVQDGMSIFAMPLPERGTAGLMFETPKGTVQLTLPRIPERPGEGREAGSRDLAQALLDRVKSVWARLRDVEAALADPARLWARLAALWLGDAAVADPEMDRIVRHARELALTLDLLDRAPRRMLRRTHRMIPLSRVQEIDRKSMAWLIRQPGETMAERGGDRQRVRAVAREENFNTLENRVLLSYAILAGAVARGYRNRHTGAPPSGRVRLVANYETRCQKLERNFRERDVIPAEADATPNFVLQNNPNYSKVWRAWQDLLRRGRILDELWRWQARSWEEFCAVAVIVALQSVPGARAVAVSPLVFREEQEEGCWIEHVNPLAAIYLPNVGVTIELSYRMQGGSVLSRFGAPIWLRMGRVGSAEILPRWAIWPLWHAVGGLEDGEAEEVAALLVAGRAESVRGGITIRPTSGDTPAEMLAIQNVACLTLGASGAGLKLGIEQLASVLLGLILAPVG